MVKTKISEAGAWSSKSIDISQDMYMKMIHDGKSEQLETIGAKFIGGNIDAELKISLTCWCTNPIRPSIIYCGDNKGYVHVIDVNKWEKQNTYNVADVSVSSITTNGFYVVIVFIDGSCSVFDSAFGYLSNIEKPFKKDVVSLSEETKNCLKARIIEDSYSKKYAQGYNSAHNFRLITLHTPWSLRLQTFDAEYRTKLFQCSYDLDGVVAGYEIHPSNEYLVAISDQGFFLYFKIETGELRGKVPIMSDPLGIAIDPSGLYVATSVNNNSIEPNSVIRKKWMLNTEKISSCKGSRTRIVFYEFGTGNFATEINCLFEISWFGFSPNRKQFIAGSKYGWVSIWAIGERLQSVMSMSPDLWSSFPIYIKNEYMKEIELENYDKIQRVPLKENLEYVKEEYPAYIPVDRQFDADTHQQRLANKEKYIQMSPRQQMRTTQSDHQKLLREREAQYTRNNNETSPIRYESPIQRQAEERKDKIMYPRKIIDVAERQRDNYSIVPPTSSYFKVDEPSVQAENKAINIQTPLQNKAIEVEVGESQEKDSLSYSDHKQDQRRITKQKYNKWEDDEESQQSINSPVVYPYPAAYPNQVMMPAQHPNINQIYKTPEGKLLIPAQSVQLANKLQTRSDSRENRTGSISKSRSNLTPINDEIERSSDFETHKSNIHVQDSPDGQNQFITPHGIQPYQKSKIINQAYVPSKLTELYKRRENVGYTNKYQDERLKVDPREEQMEYQQPVRIAQRAPQHIVNPHISVKPQNEVRPDPIDIDDGLEYTSNNEVAQDPESLQRAFVLGMRKADNHQPMSLNRFRQEYQEDIAPARHDSGDIDRFSDSNYSVVEQAYKDMDEFDIKVETYGRGKHFADRIVDDRAFGEKSHQTINNVFPPQRMQKNKIRY